MQILCSKSGVSFDVLKGRNLTGVGESYFRGDGHTGIK